MATKWTNQENMIKKGVILNTLARGGSRPGAGRKPLGPVTVKFPVTMTEAQRDKVKRLGGAAWVRAQIDAARIDTKKS